MANEYDNPTLREENARSKELTRKLRLTWIYIVGCGALGSNLAENLVRQGAMNVKLFDFDRVERHNMSTSTFSLRHVGKKKVDATAESIGMALNLWLETKNIRVDAQNGARFLKNAGVVVDCTDNHESRLAVAESCAKNKVPCLRLGMSADGMYGRSEWAHLSAAPEDVEGDPCDVAATRNLILLTVAMGIENLLLYLETEVYRESEVTLRDLRISS